MNTKPLLLGADAAAYCLRFLPDNSRSVVHNAQDTPTERMRSHNTTQGLVESRPAHGRRGTKVGLAMSHRAARGHHGTKVGIAISHDHSKIGTMRQLVLP